MKRMMWLVVLGILFLQGLLMGNMFITSLGGSGSEWGSLAIPTSDGNYLVGGNTNSFGAGGYDWIIVKVSGTGDEVIWAKTFGTSSDDKIMDIIETSDGGYLAVGLAPRDPDAKCAVIKLDSEGNVLWQRHFDIDYTLNSLNSAIETSDGYILVGETYSGGMGILLSKFSFDGNLQWTKKIDIYNWEPHWCIRSTNDGGFAILGLSSISGEVGSNFCLSKFDGNGNWQWTRWWGIPDIKDDPNSFFQTSDGGYIVVGVTYSNIYDFMISRLDENGNHIWSRTISTSGNDRGCNVIEKDNNYIVTAFINGMPSLLKFDSDGNLLWAKHLPYGVPSGGYGGGSKGMSLTQDGGFVIAGGYQGEITITKFNENEETCQEEPLTGIQTTIPNLQFASPQPVFTSLSPSYLPPLTETSPGLNLNIICSYLGEKDYTFPSDNDDSKISSIYLMVLTFFGNGILVKVLNPFTRDLRFSISDVSGKEVFSKVYPVSPMIRIYDEKMEKLPQGIYFLKVYSGKEEIGKFKLIKKNH